MAVVNSCGGLGNLALQGFIGGLSSSAGFLLIMVGINIMMKQWYKYKNKDKITNVR